MAGNASRMTQVDRGHVEGKNPYGKSKDWSDEGKSGQSFISADDSLAYKSTPKSVMIDPMTESKGSGEEGSQQEEATPDKPYNQVNFKKRYDDLKRHHDKTIDKHKTDIEGLKQQIRENTPQYKPPTSPEELAQFKKDNPSVYNVVETVAHMQVGNELDTLKEELKTVRQSLAKAESEKAWLELKEAVPDYEDIKQDPNFHSWVETQPKEIQAWVYENGTEVSLAVQAINLYKASIGRPIPSNQLPPDSYAGADEAIQTRTQRSLPSASDRMWTTTEIGSLTPTQFEKYRDEIDAAYAEGRISRD